MLKIVDFKKPREYVESLQQGFRRDQEVEGWLLPGMVPEEPALEFEMGNVGLI